VKKGLFDLLAVQDVGMTVTESLAMSPAASVSGFYFSHPQAQYFNVGPVGQDQAADLAARSGVDLSAVQRAIAPNLG
jgi:5-methyltetrahydrofolate--homocysteine methyltransferase